MNHIRVALIEDHDVVRIGLRTTLESQNDIQVVGEAASGTQGLKLLQTTQPDVAIVDIGLPGMDGIELTRKFREFQSDHEDVATKVLILTMQGNEESVLASFAAGADSYCMKDMGMERMVEAIRMTHSGNPWIDPAIASIVLRQMRQSISKATSKATSKAAHESDRTVEIRALEADYEDILQAYPLTTREQEILELMVNGCSNLMIAERLFITVGTVKTHVRNILSKLCANDRTEAAVRALRSGIVS
ncbi:MAG: response regulator [Microcoleaceae cyanobacterium]